MTQFTITLPPELASYVADAVARGDWASTDEFIAHAVGLMRTVSVLGGPLTPATPERPPAPKPEPTPSADTRKTPASGTVPVVDMTRQAFDSSSFMSELTRRLHAGK